MAAAVAPQVNSARFKRINGREPSSVRSASGALGAGTQLELTIKGSNRTLMESGVARISATNSRLTGGAPRIMAFGTAFADNWS